MAAGFSFRSCAAFAFCTVTAVKSKRTRVRSFHTKNPFACKDIILVADSENKFVNFFLGHSVLDKIIFKIHFERKKMEIFIIVPILFLYIKSIGRTAPFCAVIGTHFAAFDKALDFNVIPCIIRGKNFFIAALHRFYSFCFSETNHKQITFIYKTGIIIS